MTSVNSVNSASVTPSTTQPSGTQATAGAAPAAAVNAKTGLDAAAAASSSVPSGVRPTIPRAIIDGSATALGKQLKLPSYVPTPGQLAGTQVWGAQGGSSGNRGYIEATVTPAPGGWVFNVQTHHNSPNDEVSLYLSARITDPPHEHWVVLSTLFTGPMEGTGKDGIGMCTTDREFYVSLEDINAFLAKKAGTKADGKTPKLQLQVGDPLTIDAVWKVGHESGGRRDQTKGYVITPETLGRASPLDVRAGKVPVAKPIAASVGKAADKPVDLTLKVPDEIVAKYPKVFAPGAKLVSRREHELKFEPKTFDELRDFTTRLIGIAKLKGSAQEAALEQVFGEKGWHLELTDRYYQKDARGAYVTYQPGELVWNVKDEGGERAFDFAGLPKVAGMYDQYQDSVTQGGGYYGTQKFQVARENGAVRFRDGEIKAGENKGTIGKFNLKPGGGMFDPTSLISTRVEYSLDTLPGIAKDAAAMEQMRSFLDQGPEPFNPLVEFKKKSYNLSGEVVRHNVLDNNAKRYKFTLKHASGLEKEISCDFIHLTSKHAAVEPPSTQGKPIAAKYNHWQAQFAAQKLPFSTQPDAVNKATFVEYTNNGRDRVEVEVEVAIDAAGKHSVKETLSVYGRQVEIEMDHVQLFTTGAVQSGTMATQRGTNARTSQEEDRIFKSLSDNATLNGPPTIHNLSDLADPGLYADGSYQQMKVAVNKLRQAFFPGGVNPTRQKSAYGLEMMGQIPASGDLKITTAMQPYDSSTRVGVSGNVITVRGDMASKTPMTLTLAINEFPITIALKGGETAQQIADAITRTLDACVFYEPTQTVQAASPSQAQTFQISLAKR